MSAVAQRKRLAKSIAARRQKRVGQFGQSGDGSTLGGSLGCTHTGLQFLAWLWKGVWYSHDDVSRLAGYPASAKKLRRGLRPAEVERFCRRAGLPYEVRFGLTANEIIRLADERGPVGIGHAYRWWPEWKGATYDGIKADGRPNGYASPLGHAGKDQLSGFTGAHWGTLLGRDESGRIHAWESNHGSGRRPEIPVEDVMTPDQFRDVYDSYRTELGRSLYALVPTKTLPA